MQRKKKNTTILKAALAKRDLSVYAVMKALGSVKSSRQSKWYTRLNGSRGMTRSELKLFVDTANKMLADKKKPCLIPEEFPFDTFRLRLI